MCRLGSWFPGDLEMSFHTWLEIGAKALSRWEHSSLYHINYGSHVILKKCVLKAAHVSQRRPWMVYPN